MSFYIECPDDCCEWRRGPYDDSYWSRRHLLDDYERFFFHFRHAHGTMPVFVQDDSE